MLISMVNGVLLIGKLPGLAMAASEDMRPVPSVEEPELMFVDDIVAVFPSQTAVNQVFT